MTWRVLLSTTLFLLSLPLAEAKPPKKPVEIVSGANDSLFYDATSAKGKAILCYMHTDGKRYGGKEKAKSGKSYWVRSFFKAFKKAKNNFGGTHPKTKAKKKLWKETDATCAATDPPDDGDDDDD